MTDNATVLATVKPVNHWVAWFKPLLRAFTKAHGTKPSDAMLTAAVAIANKHKRPGIECLFIAMCLRNEGCTVPQFTSVATSGMGVAVGPANNKRKALVKAKWLTETVAAGGKPYAYQLAFTDKGAAAMNAILAQVAEASTPDKAKGKAKKAKAKKAAPTVTVTPEANVTPDTVAVDSLSEPATPEAAPADQPQA